MADLCSAKSLGEIRKDIGVREENFIANICRIKESTQDIFNKFSEVTRAQKLTPGAPIDIREEVQFYNSQLNKIKNIAQATKVG